jgi:hypothetical protein
VPDELHIEVKRAGDLPDLSRRALEKALADYGNRLMQDAESIENARRLTPGTPMITDAAIVLADLNARNSQMRRKPTRKFRAMSTLEYAATFASGGFVGYIAKPIGAAGFALCAVLGILLHSLKKEDDE